MNDLQRQVAEAAGWTSLGESQSAPGELWGCSPTCPLPAMVADYPRDLNAIVALLEAWAQEQPGREYGTWRRRLQPLCRVSLRDGDTEHVAWGDTLAEAACRAYLRAKGREGGA